jgi:hypothetical protein
MEILIIILLLLLLIFLAISVQRNIFLKKEISKITVDKINLQNELLKINNKFENLLKESYFMQTEAHKRGIEEGINRNTLTVKIEPIENITNANYCVYKRETIEIGFKYQLYNNNFPTEFKSIHILKTLKKSEVNEENIKKIISGIEKIKNLRNGSFIVSKTVGLLKENLLKQIPKFKN